MSGHKNFSMWLGITAFLVLTLAGCNDGPRGCLGLGCGTSGPTTQSNTTVGTSEPPLTSTSAFTCAVISDYSTVRSGEQFGISVVAQGQFTPPVNITAGLQFPVESFYSAIKIFGMITNSGSTTLVNNGGVVVKDARGLTTSCSQPVSVLTATSSTSASSGLACDIVPSLPSPPTGARVDFQLYGRGGSGVYTFSKFSPISGQTVADTYITKVSDTQSKVSFSYTNPVTRFASVVVTNGADSNVCRVPIFVGGSYPTGYQSNWDWSSLPNWFYYSGFFPAPVPITVPAQNSCDVQMSPNPGITGTISNLKITVPAYVGSEPFQIDTITGYNNDRRTSSLIDDLPSIPRPSLLERTVRVRDSGYHQITVAYRNAAGTVRGSCAANYLAKPASQFAISPDQVSDLAVNTYSGAPPRYGATTPVPDTSHRGARVAFGDVNGDGIPDLIIGSGRDLVNANPVYRVVVRDGRNLANVLYDFNPLPSHPDGNGGVFVAAGDINADGKAEVIVGQDGDYAAGKSGSWIKVYDFSTGVPVLKHAIQPYGATGNYGVRVAVGDVNGDGFADILAIPGAEGGALVKVYSGQQLAIPATPLWSALYSFTALTNAGDATLHSGAFIAAGDLNGDGKADILTSLDTKMATDGANYKRSIYIYDGASGLLQGYKPVVFGNLYDGGIRIAAGDLDGDGRADILAVPGVGVPNDGYGSQFKAFDFLLGQTSPAVVFWPQTFNYASGLFVGAGAGGL